MGLEWTCRPKNWATIVQHYSPTTARAEFEEDQPMTIYDFQSLKYNTMPCPLYSVHDNTLPTQPLSRLVTGTLKHLSEKQEN